MGRDEWKARYFSFQEGSIVEGSNPVTKEKGRYMRIYIYVCVCVQISPRHAVPVTRKGGFCSRRSEKKRLI